MKIHKISFKNFYSYHEAELDLSHYGSGLVGIEGINKDGGGSNGAGKSVILEALVFGLFGRTIRKSNESAMVNLTNKRGMVVELQVEDLLIRRGRKPSVFELYRGSEPLTQAHAASTQEVLEDALGIDYKTFMSAAVFGQHSTVDFLDATPDDKRKMLNGFLNLDYIFDKKANIKTRRSKLKNEIRDRDVLITKLEKDIYKYDMMINESLISAEQGDILQEYDLEDILKIEKDNWRVEQEIRKLEDLCVTSSDVRNARLTMRAGIGSDQSWTCKSCGTEFGGKLDQEGYDRCARIVELHDAKVKVAKAEIKAWKDKLVRMPCTPQEYTKWSKVGGDSNVRTLLADSRAELERASMEKFEMQDKYDMLGFWDKAFSEKGLIKYVIRTVRDYLNEKCNYYLGYLTQGQISLTFDDELVENIEVGGSKRYYISLSGGEKRKVNLAVMLALQSVLSVSNGTESNVLFFDEVAENLDSHGIQGLTELLYELRKDKTVFVITHNPYLASYMESHKKITITKESGVSTLS